MANYQNTYELQDIYENGTDQKIRFSTVSRDQKIP